MGIGFGRFLIAAVIAVGVVAGAPSAAADPLPPDADVRAKFDALLIKGRAPKTGYDRSLFGESWTDDVTVPGGLNGCDTRNDILRRDLVDVVLKPGSNDCAVLRGILNDP